MQRGPSLGLGIQRTVFESRGGRPGLPVSDSPNGPYGLRGRKVTLNGTLTTVDSVSGLQVQPGPSVQSAGAVLKAEVDVLGSLSLMLLMVLTPVLNWANVCSPEHTSDTSTNYDSFLN